MYRCLIMRSVSEVARLPPSKNNPNDFLFGWEVRRSDSTLDVWDLGTGCQIELSFCNFYTDKWERGINDFKILPGLIRGCQRKQWRCYAKAILAHPSRKSQSEKTLRPMWSWAFVWFLQLSLQPKIHVYLVMREWCDPLFSPRLLKNCKTKTTQPWWPLLPSYY